jgi:hypothetical protein
MVGIGKGHAILVIYKCNHAMNMVGSFQEVRNRLPSARAKKRQEQLGELRGCFLKNTTFHEVPL